MGDKSKEENRNYVTHNDDKHIETLIKYWECEIHKDNNCGINKEFEKECIAKYNKIKSNRLEHSYLFEGLTQLKDVYVNKEYKEHLKSVHKDYIKEVSSILQLSFNPDIYSRIVLSDELSEDFLYCFMNAWYAYYDPSLYDITIIIDKFMEATKNCSFKTTRAYITNILNGYLIDFYNEY